MRRSAAGRPTKTRSARKKRVKRHKRRCKDYGAWDPRGWFCWVVTYFEEVWVTVSVTAREWVCAAVEATEELLAYGERLWEWLVSVADHRVCVLTGNDTGYWPIVGGNREREIPSRPRATASMRSMALALVPGNALDIGAYNANGNHVDIELRDGTVWWRADRGEWVLLAPETCHIPHHLRHRVTAGNAAAVSYDERRLGDVAAPPRFDLIVASGDRLMGKVAGKDSLYIAILEHPYVHRTRDGKSIRLPQSFFKLDPECGRRNADKRDLLTHLNIGNTVLGYG